MDGSGSAHHTRPPLTFARLVRRDVRLAAPVFLAGFPMVYGKEKKAALTSRRMWMRTKRPPQTFPCLARVDMSFLVVFLGKIRDHAVMEVI